MSSLATARAKIQKMKTKGMVDSAVVIDEDFFHRSLPHIPTGSLALDYLIGGKPNDYGILPCPGWPRGRLSNLYGQPGTGKTTLALMACAEAIAQGGTAVYMDFECEVEMGYAQKLGVPVTDSDKFLLLRPETLEEGVGELAIYISSGVDLVVIDSVGAGIPNMTAAKDGSAFGEIGRIGLVASVWSNALPRIKNLVAKSNTCVIGISQIRQNIDLRNPAALPYTVQGGNAWKFYSSVQMYLRQSTKQKSDEGNFLSNKQEETVSGFKVKARLDKCKVSGSYYGEQDFYMATGAGVDNIRTMFEVGTAHKVIQKSGSWYTWVTPHGESLRTQGEAKMLDLIREYEHENQKGESLLASQVLPLLQSSEMPMPDPEEDEIQIVYDTDVSALLGLQKGADVDLSGGDE